MKKILKDHSLRVTDCRIDVLQMFLDANYALSFRDLEDRFAAYDRVTLYRTLNSFMENGVLHRIPDDSGFARYGICQDTCTPDHHQHDHIHFKCDECGNIECLPGHYPPRVSLPGYKVTDTSVILKGVCQHCMD